MSEQDFLSSVKKTIVNGTIMLVLSVLLSVGGSMIYFKVDQEKTKQSIQYLERELDKKADRFVLEPRLYNIEVLLQELREDLKDERKLNNKNK